MSPISWTRIAFWLLALVSIWGKIQSAHAGLIINPTWDTTITSDVNSAIIQATINSAIAEYEAKFADPITVDIKFQEGGGLGSSSTWIYSTNYASFRSALNADATTANDATALATLPIDPLNPVTGDSTIYATKANLQAVGYSVGATPDGFNGTITLNTSIMNLSRSGPQNPALYDLKAVVQHEIDEVLGTSAGVGGSLGPRPIDFFRYASAGIRNYTTSGDTAYFSIDGGSTLLVQYNQSGSGDYGDFHTGIGLYVQNAFGTPGAQPNLGVELTMLDVVGFDLVAVPEPNSLALVGMGIAGFVAARHRKRKTTACSDKNGPSTRAMIVAVTPD